MCAASMEHIHVHVVFFFFQIEIDRILVCFKNAQANLQFLVSSLRDL